jgi:hypothetical protein
MARVTSSLRASGLSTHAANNSSHQQGPAKPNGQRKAAKASCYVRQQRYREKQRLYVDRLEATVKRLRVDVDEHLTARQNAQRALVSDQLRALCGTDSRDSRKQPRTMSATEVVEIMRKCMEAFESGMHAHQEKVTETAMRDDVRYGELIGRDGILDQWRCFMLYFNSAAPILENCAYSVECLEQGTTVGHVSATLVVRLTHLGLAAVFPQARQTAARPHAEITDGGLLSLRRARQSVPLRPHGRLCGWTSRRAWRLRGRGDCTAISQHRCLGPS